MVVTAHPPEHARAIILNGMAPFAGHLFAIKPVKTMATAHLRVPARAITLNGMELTVRFRFATQHA